MIYLLSKQAFVGELTETPSLLILASGIGITAVLFREMKALMDQTQVFQAFSTLPPEAQQVVANLVALLSKQYGHTRSMRKKTVQLADEKFIGIWKDREEMKDSNRYVRTLRQQEWTDRA